MSKFNIIKIGTCFFWLLLSASGNNAQVETDVQTNPTPVSCEELLHVIDKSILLNNEHEETKLVFIFRKGKNESSAKFNKKRVKNLKKFLGENKDYLHRSIFAVGAKSRTLPKLEIYIVGKLSDTLFFKEKDKRSCVD